MTKSDPATIASQNRRKIEKDKRRKAYHDSQVQGTNNSSIVSKRSVEVLYNPILEPDAHDWFQYFVPKGKRRSPAINRGYWLRMESIKQAVLRIQSSHQGKVRVVNLGCGFDPFPFKMLHEQDCGYEFFDFDYPELVQQKLNLLKKSEKILDIVGSVQEPSANLKELGVILATETYKLVGCDLKNNHLYRKQLNALVNDSDGPVIFIAEVSLAYMKPEHANPVIEILSQVLNAHVLVLEQIMPSGDRHYFAKKMLYHFQHLTSPLQCVETYSTKEKQKKRFEQYFSNVEVFDLFECWNQLVSGNKKELLDTVEEFDEWEEFIVFCQHYVVIHATNSQKTIFNEPSLASELQSAGTLSIKTIGQLDLKFAAACSGQNGLYVNGGMFQNRQNSTILVDATTELALDVSNPPLARMCHTFTSLGGGNLLLIGGRTRPKDSLDDVWLFAEITKTWTKLGNLGTGLFRHEAIALDHRLAIVYGNGKFIRVELNDEFTGITVTHLGQKGCRLPNLSSYGIAFDKTSNIGYILGGTSDSTTPIINDGLYKFVLQNDEMFVEEVLKSPHLGRIGAMLKLTPSKLMVIGGIGHQPLTQADTVIQIDLQQKEIKSLSIPDNVWDSLPVFIGSRLAGDKIVGGGAVCYSFGSHYNSTYSVEFDIE